MRPTLLLLILLCLAASLSPLARSTAAATAPQPLRVGTYDSRAIAVAFAASRFNPVAEKMKEHDAAKRAGDQKRVRELEAWGAEHQRRLHRQGFARVPVDDLLVPVKDALAKVATERGVQLVASSYDYKGADVEELDLTDDLVRLFEPSEKTLQTIRELRQQPPVDLDELTELEAHSDH